MSSAGPEPHLHIESLRVRLGKFHLEDINLSCNRGEYHILMGPTGSGKTSLVKSVLGLNTVLRGTIRVGDRDITGDPPERRRMGYVPQNYALFPHLNVEGNIRFGLKGRKLTPDETDATVVRLCGILNLEDLRNRAVNGLSGGERQKVAIGRVLAARPDVLLLDEPFSSIDEGAKRALWFELKRIIKEVRVTTLHITHNHDEAYTLGERLSVMIRGHLVQSGAKEAIFEKPCSEEVARYLNYRNIFSGVAEHHPEGARIHLGHFDLVIGRRFPEGKVINLCIRQQDIKIIKEDSPIKDSLKRNVFSGRIDSLFPLPESCIMRFQINGSPRTYDFELKLPGHLLIRHQLSVGKRLRIALWEPNIILFE